jgi:hypothetical protein
MRKQAATYIGSVCEKHPDLGGLRKQSTRCCVQCSKENAAAYYAERRDILRERHRQYARENIKKNSERAIAWAKANKERHAKNAASWRAANPERALELTANWVKKNLHVCAERESKKRSVAKQATPAWANEFFMREAYHLARLRSQMFGFKWHVDHIVPLVSKTVCGLHCEANMQVIPEKANTSKGNRHWPDMWVDGDTVSCSSLTYTALSA